MRSPESTSSRSRVLLALIVMVGAAVRFSGLTWGIPGELHFISLHPDEFRLLDPVANSLASGRVSPETYDDGGLPFDLLYLASFAATRLGWGADSAGLYLLGRAISALFGGATVILVHLLGAETAGRRAGLLAAALFALAPGHVQHSHYATGDVMATFFVALATLGSIRVARSASHSSVLLAGAAAGLAAATKYPAGLVLLSVLAAVWSRRASAAAEPPRWALSLEAVQIAIAAFLAACPFHVMDAKKAWSHIHHELFVYPRLGHGVQFEGTGNGWWFHLTTNFPFAFTWPFALAACVGSVLLWRRGPTGRVMLAFAAPAFLAMGASEVRFMRYTLVLTPVLAVAAAVLVERLAGGASARSRMSRIAAVVLLLAPESWATLRVVGALSRPDPREQATLWIRENVPPGSGIGLVSEPTYEVPTLVPLEGLDVSSTAPAAAEDWFQRQVWQGNASYTFLLCHRWDVEVLLRGLPEYFVLSELRWNNYVRSGNAEALAFLAALDEGWEEVARFDTFAPEERWIYGASHTPQDWLFSFPQIRIYRLR